jgi:N-acetylmuramoyl-L-alanine amidase
VLLVAGCGTAVVDTSLVAQSQGSRVRFVVLHYTMGDAASSLATLTGPDVSSHYVVTEGPRPRVYRLVDESRRADHAGASFWRGHVQLNLSSIGIEIVNPGPVAGSFAPYDGAQVDAVVALLKDIVRRHGIAPDAVLGHSDIAPQRKIDPGPAFPWERLAREGLVAWPDAARVAALRPAYELALPDVAWFQQRLARHGYEVPRHGTLDTATRNVVAAFQMKYRPRRYDGEPDAETAAVLAALTDGAAP